MAQPAVFKLKKSSQKVQCKFLALHSTLDGQNWQKYALNWKDHGPKTQSKSIVNIILHRHVQSTPYRTASIVLAKTSITDSNFDMVSQRLAVGKKTLESELSETEYVRYSHWFCLYRVSTLKISGTAGLTLSSIH